MTCNHDHWIDNNLRSSQKFELGKKDVQIFFYKFYKFSDLEEITKKSSKKNVSGQI
jgi:hypothetical protein